MQVDTLKYQIIIDTPPISSKNQDWKQTACFQSKHLFSTSFSYYAPVICNHCPPPSPYGDERGIAGLMCGAVTFLSSPAVPGKCRACDITQIYSRGIYYYKEQGYDSQQVPAVQGF